MQVVEVDEFDILSGNCNAFNFYKKEKEKGKQ